jgi:hypothetical protein
LEGSAVDHFGRQIGVRWVLVGVLLVVGFLGLRWITASEARAQAQEAEARAGAKAAKVQANKILEADDSVKVAPHPQRHFLEKGKSYYFSWQNSIGPAVVLEEPRDNWVKVRTDGKARWINLSTVQQVMPDPEVKEEAKEQGETAGWPSSVNAVITLDGKPVKTGSVNFYADQLISASGFGFGQLTVPRLPSWTFKVTVMGDGVPEKYGDKEKTPIKVELKKGQNQLHLDLTK